MTDSVFDLNKLIPQDEQIDPNKDYLTELVGVNKKFADAAALAKGKAESDIFVKRIEAENKAMREELARQSAELKTRTSLDEFLAKAKAQNEQDGQRSTPDNQADQTVLNEEKINQIVETRLTAKEAATQAAANVRVVTEGLQKVWGSNYVANLEQRAQELGLDKAFLDNLAKTAPKAFFAILGVPTEQQRSVFEAPKGTVQTPAGPPGSTKNYKYYNKLKETLPPSEYWSPKIQNEMFEMAKKLGDDFYS